MVVFKNITVQKIYETNDIGQFFTTQRSQTSTLRLILQTCKVQETQTKS